MTAPIRLSVRALVGFSYFAPDILPFGASLMEEGRAAHLRRQALSGAEREVALSWQGSEQGLDFVVTGRMDLYDAGQTPPLIEEIKRSGDRPPEAPRPEHLQQALCYGYMLCLRDELPAVMVRVSYARTDGELTASFEERYEIERLREAFFALLKPFAAWQKKLLSLKEKRDISIEALPFPYPAYRPGQREMAAQVYTAIVRKKRLFAMMPTGTGKSAAVLYPALKAMGLKHTEQIFCLTARGTARLAMEKELRRMRAEGLKAKALTLVAKEKLCPKTELRCDPAFCDRALGHYLRQQEALRSALRCAAWDERTVRHLSQKHRVCPFEFSLALSQIADVVICDYNYVFDPRVNIRRMFDQVSQVSVLLDEAHNLPDRARDMLSGELSTPDLVLARRALGRSHGRGNAVYRRMTDLLSAAREIEEGAEDLSSLRDAVEGLMDALRVRPEILLPSALIRSLLGLQDALKRQAEEPESYKLLIQPAGKERALTLLCLDFTPFLREAGARYQGFVCYSATLQPLRAMRDLLGGDQEDACFELPSPFPKENLLALQLSVSTRYAHREQSAGEVAGAIRAMFMGRPGKYIAFFPSYGYLRQVAERLEDLPVSIQRSGMDEAARVDFLSRFTKDDESLLGLCVLGGVFAEGVDLPGLSLIGVCVVGVGLPQVSPRQEAIRRRADDQGLSGFDIAYRYPGMHKVLQAAGRLIRSESDRGVLLLVDDRYRQRGYQRLLPDHIRPIPLREAAEIAPRLQDFWDL